MATCENGHQVRKSAQFCGVCGADMQVACPKGHHNVSGTRLCETCGSAIQSPGSTDPSDDGTALLLSPKEPVDSPPQPTPPPSPSVVERTASTEIVRQPPQDVALARTE